MNIYRRNKSWHPFAVVCGRTEMKLILRLRFEHKQKSSEIVKKFLLKCL